MTKKSKAQAAVAPEATKPTPGSKQVWKLMDHGSTVAAGLLARQASELTWKVATGKKPPSEKKSLDASVREVALWAFVGGGLTELVRVLVKRSAATYWVKSTGHLPPGMKTKTKANEEDKAL
ncbi:MAG TPA: DUF4235 domain-containing protein [Aeromicrobium sp.]|nr:DUF4235 domain-containing protein [Aeromicrobium sp.]